MNNVASASNPTGQIVLSYAYDLNNNCITMIDGAGRETVHTFDEHDQLHTSQQPDVPLLTVTRYRDSRPRSVEWGANQKSTYYHTDSGKINRIIHTSGANTIAQRYGYDGLDHVTWALNSNGPAPDWRVQTYRRYDSLGRVTRERTVVPD